MSTEPADSVSSIDTSRPARVRVPTPSTAATSTSVSTSFALVETFANTVSSELVARVVGYAREGDHGCPFGYSQLCDGPVGPRLPCPGCIDAVRSEGVGEWVVWQRAVSEDRA